MLTNTKHPYKKIYFLCMITMIILLNGCVKKDQNLSKKFSSNSTIISMTVTHSNKQNDSFQSDIILLDTKDNSTETITSVIIGSTRWFALSQNCPQLLSWA